MTPSIRALLDNLIDYAGLFPPARLDMPDAALAYSEHRASPFAWMLGRFICPAARLGELERQLDLLAPVGTAPLRISLLGAGGDDADVFLCGLDGELKTACDFTGRNAGRVVIDVIETRWPPAVLATCDAAETHTLAGMAADRIAAAASRLNREDAEAPINEAPASGHGVATRSAGGAAAGTADVATGPAGAPSHATGWRNRTVRPFFEAARTEAWRTEIPEFVLGLADHNGGAVESRCGPVGMKLRTGGVEARMFPSSEQVAFVLAECCRHGLAFKATAGLHHPIRHYNDSVATRMHGFLNLFGGAVLLHAATAPGSPSDSPRSGSSPFGEEELRELLDDESQDAITFHADGMAWRGHRASLERIALARSLLATSFGSCSFDEPVEDLKRLGLLAPSSHVPPPGAIEKDNGQD